MVHKHPPAAVGRTGAAVPSASPRTATGAGAAAAGDDVLAVLAS